MSALCDGRSVSQRVAIVVDSVTAQASPSVQRIAGRRADLVLSLFNEVGNARCGDQSGTGTWGGEIPAALETATDPDRRLEWRIEGDQVIVNFNPLAMDNNLGMALPLSGAAGRWWLASIAGEVAAGRALPEGP